MLVDLPESCKRQRAVQRWVRNKAADRVELFLVLSPLLCYLGFYMSCKGKVNPGGAGSSRGDRGSDSERLMRSLTPERNYRGFCQQSLLL